jgi:hypothetical protein
MPSRSIAVDHEASAKWRMIGWRKRQSIATSFINDPEHWCNRADYARTLAEAPSKMLRIAASTSEVF